MAIPTVREDIAVPGLGPEQLDGEIDRTNSRICWTDGTPENYVCTADINQVTGTLENVVRWTHVPTRRYFFPNRAEWELLETGSIGLFFNGPQATIGDAATVERLDLTEATPYAREVLSLSADSLSAFLMDAWEELEILPPGYLTPPPLLLLDVVPVNEREVLGQRATLMVFDPFEAARNSSR